MEDRRWSNVEYKIFGVQRTTDKEASRSIYWSIYYWQDSFNQCDWIMIADFNENTSNYECQLSSTI